MMNEINEDQQKILDKAIKLLEKYDKVDVSDYICYFVVSENDYSEIGSQYDCCDYPECMEATLKELKKDYPDCNYLYQYNNNDYDTFNLCYQCGRRLNDTLTWIEYEFNHHSTTNQTKKDFQISSVAFEIRVIFESMPSIDFAKQDQKDFIIKVVDYANIVISELEE